MQKLMKTRRMQKLSGRKVILLRFLVFSFGTRETRVQNVPVLLLAGGNSAHPGSAQLATGTQAPSPPVLRPVSSTCQLSGILSSHYVQSLFCPVTILFMFLQIPECNV